MLTNYDKIASSYDFIRQVALGNTIVDAQVSLLKFIPANSRILIIGGGTGWIIGEINKIHSAGLVIDYVESSARMIELSAKWDSRSNQISFIHEAIENYSVTESYDVILTPFLFDNFKIEKISLIFDKLTTYLKKDGVWLYADFVYNEKDGRLWQRVLLKLMYFFFRITCNIETQELISMEQFFVPLYSNIFEASCYHDFIKSIVYKKNK